MKPLLLLATAILASCATRPPPTHFTAPKPAVDVSQSAAAVRANAVAGFVVSQRLENQVESLTVKTATLQDSLAKSFIEATKLKDQKTATEAELDSLYESMLAGQTQVLALVDEAQAAKVTAVEQAVLRAKAEGDLERLTADAAARDAETATLRLQNADMEKLISAQQAAVDRSQARMEKAEKAAAVGNYLKWVIGISVLVVFVAAVGLVYLKFLKPI